MSGHQNDHTTRIRALNDAFRQTFVGGRVVATRGVMAMEQTIVAELLERVRGYSDFNPDNDPYGEHDFGSFDCASQRLFWKIDYYDTSMKYGSPNPADPSVTVRVLTIMLAEEW